MPRDREPQSMRALGFQGLTLALCATFASVLTRDDAPLLSIVLLVSVGVFFALGCTALLLDPRRFGDDSPLPRPDVERQAIAKQLEAKLSEYPHLLTLATVLIAAATMLITALAVIAP